VASDVVRPFHTTLENHDIHRWITLLWPDPPLVLDGPMDGEAFLAYVEQLLAPSLRPGGRLYRTHSDDNRVAITAGGNQAFFIGMLPWTFERASCP
jgi:hypothetical protein